MQFHLPVNIYFIFYRLYTCKYLTHNLSDSISVCPSLCLHLCLCLSVCLSLSLVVSLSLSLSHSLSVSISLFLFFALSLSFSQSCSLSLCLCHCVSLSLSLSLSLSVCLSLSCLSSKQPVPCKGHCSSPPTGAGDTAAAGGTEQPTTALGRPGLWPPGKGRPWPGRVRVGLGVWASGEASSSGQVHRSAGEGEAAAAGP